MVSSKLWVRDSNGIARVIRVLIAILGVQTSPR